MRIWLKGSPEALTEAAWDLKDGAANKHMEASRNKDIKQRRIADELHAMADDILEAVRRERGK